MFCLQLWICYNSMGHLNALHRSKLLEVRWIFFAQQKWKVSQVFFQNFNLKNAFSRE